jgi:hypothetical protein
MGSNLQNTLYKRIKNVAVTGHKKGRKGDRLLFAGV